MTRSNKRNAKTRVVPKTQEVQSKSTKPNIGHWDSSKDEIPTTSKQLMQLNSKKDGNSENSVKKTISSSSMIVIKKGEKLEKEQTKKVQSSKRKRKPINRLICFSDTDDDEHRIGVQTMRYVDVARSAMIGTETSVQAQKTPTQLLNMGLEEFPLLQPSRFLNSELSNRHLKRVDSDSSITGSVVNSHGDDISDITECFLQNENANVFNKIDQMADNTTDDQCIDENRNVECCDTSSTGSYWAEGSNETGSENEKISCVEDGGGDADYTFTNENHCPQQNVPQSSIFSQEWLDSIVRSLAIPFGVTVPSFNFIQPDINFSRFERQFDDPHYKRMEDRAIFALRLALNKSFFRKGNYI